MSKPLDEYNGQMSLHAIFGQGANVRGGTCPFPVNLMIMKHSFCTNPLAIRKTCPCNEYSLKPHIVQLACKGIPMFLPFGPKHRLI